MFQVRCRSGGILGSYKILRCVVGKYLAVTHVDPQPNSIRNATDDEWLSTRTNFEPNSFTSSSSGGNGAHVSSHVDCRFFGRCEGIHMQQDYFQQQVFSMLGISSYILVSAIPVCITLSQTFSDLDTAHEGAQLPKTDEPGIWDCSASSPTSDEPISRLALPRSTRTTTFSQEDQLHLPSIRESWTQMHVSFLHERLHAGFVICLDPNLCRFDHGLKPFLAEA
jgi:hypothetical protein